MYYWIKKLKKDQKSLYILTDFIILSLIIKFKVLILEIK